MPPRRRPIGHEERLTLVEHLDELRSRLILSLVALAIVFAGCFWQADAILEVVNRPLERSQTAAADRSGAPPDPIQQSVRFDRRVAAAAAATAAGLERLSAVAGSLSAGSGATRAQRAALRRAAAGLDRATAQLRRAAAGAPALAPRRPVTLGVAEPFMTTVTVAGYAALLIALPLLLYQLYAYVLPAFSPREREVAMPLMFAVPALFLAGVLFAYFVVLPGAVSFLQGFNADNFDILVQARAYYRFSVMMMGGIGLLFQVPVAVVAVTSLGIVDSEQLRRNRPFYIFGAAILAAIGNASPDPFTMLMILVPLVLLFELSVRFAAWLERRERSDAPT